MSGFVYFARADDGRVKIGHSADPARRLQQLQTACASRLTLLGAIPGTPFDEAELHIRFGSSRVRNEWFNGNGRMMAQIRALLAEQPLYRPERAATERTLQTNIGEDSSERIAEAVATFLRTRYESRVIAHASADAGIPVATVAKWFERASAPSAAALMRLLRFYGAPLLQAICPDFEGIDDLVVLGRHRALSRAVAEVDDELHQRGFR